MKDVESTVSTEWTQWEEGGPDGGKGIVGAGWAGSHCFCICLSAVWALLPSADCHGRICQDGAGPRTSVCRWVTGQPMGHSSC